MKCPVCDVTLSVSGREGVEIDFCPQCRGVWLDRGELDKIIERANAAMAPAAPAYGDRPAPRYEDRGYADRGYERERRYDDDRRHYDDDDHYGDRRYGKKRKRRGGFLEDLFDFD